MPPERFELTLRDGTPVIVRPLIPEDREALAEAYRRLSPEARYHRFWTHTGEVVGDKMLNQVLDQDPQQHMTWTVLDPTRDFPPLGGASWWRDQENPAQAELSAIVLDDDQGRGVGTLLLAVMWLTAFRADIQQLIGYVQVENRQAAAWMRDCGAQGEYDGYKRDLDATTCSLYEEIIAPDRLDFRDPITDFLIMTPGILYIHFIALYPPFRRRGLGREVMRELVRNFADDRVGMVLLNAQPLQHLPHGYDHFTDEVRELPWNSPDEDLARLVSHFRSWNMQILPGTRYLLAAPEYLIDGPPNDWYPGLLGDA